MKSNECWTEVYDLPTFRGGRPLLCPRLTGSQESWFALYVQVNHEKEVTKRLEQKSLCCFLPLMDCWSKRLDRRKRISVPLFPGYVFLHTILDNYTNLNILKTPGAVHILRSSEGPVPIPAYQIDNLQKALESPEPIIPHPYLKQGDWVRVVRGPLCGCMGFLTRRDPKKGRLVLSVDLVRQSISVELDVEDIEPGIPPTGNAVS